MYVCPYRVDLMLSRQRVLKEMLRDASTQLSTSCRWLHVYRDADRVLEALFRTKAPQIAECDAFTLLFQDN